MMGCYHAAAAVNRRCTKPNRRLPHLLIAISCFHSSTTTTNGLKIALLTGSTRKSSPPTVLHPRVNTYIHNILQERGHTVHRIDPNIFPLLEKPYFAYPPGKAPEYLQSTNDILMSCDGYVCVTPEYNHSPSPALLNTLNHFGSSTFSFKPSAIGKMWCCAMYEIRCSFFNLSISYSHIIPVLTCASFSTSSLQ